MKIAGQIDIEDLLRVCPTVSRAANPGYGAAGRLTVTAGEVSFGAGRPAVIAGPCAVESWEQTLSLAQAARAAGARMLRGGAYKPRTSPHDFQGLGEEGLRILQAAGQAVGLPVVTEVMDVRLVETVAQYADMLQIGSRSMQNFPLLVEAGRSGKPVLLKRGMAATLCEWLGAAEYIALQGNLQIVLCERGIRSFAAGEYSRFTLDINAIPALREATFLPVIADPSHATGLAARVEPASRAAIEAGCDGLIIEIALQPETCPPRCDAVQAIGPEKLRRIVRFIETRREAIDWPEGSAMISAPDSEMSAHIGRRESSS